MMKVNIGLMGILIVIILMLVSISNLNSKNELLYEEYFHLTNIEKDFLPVFKKFYKNEKLRTCPISGEIMDVDERYI